MDERGRRRDVVAGRGGADLLDEDRHTLHALGVLVTAAAVALLALLAGLAGVFLGP